MYHSICFRGEIRKLLCGYHFLSGASITLDIFQTELPGFNLWSTKGKKLPDKSPYLLNIFIQEYPRK